jgi:hypothetical protein
VTQPLPPDPFQPPSYGTPPPASAWQPVRATNGLAIASLVTAFPAPPVAIGLAIGALVQLRTRDQAGKGLALAALIVSSLFTLLFAGFVTAGVAGAFDTPAVHVGTVVDAGSDRVGACLRSTSDGPSSEVGCGQGHDQEVFYVGRLPGEGFPGDARVEDLAAGACLTAFRPYVGQRYDDSDYDDSWYAPSAAEWEQGDHRVICVVVPGVSDLQGSVRS